jgi:1-acyl-sn-glycerol-3-phosphate acyltransferase
MKPDRKNTTRKEHGQLALLGSKRFAPFFFTQFLGAFNDNMFKNVLIILIAYVFGSTLACEPNTLINAAAGLFILPFFLFSALAGQMADKFEKSALIRKIKFTEILIMLGAGGAFVLNNVPLLLGMLFLMGAQSAFFGPVKYSIIPQHLRPKEVVGGNALVETGTFVAILLGTIAGGLLGQMENGRLLAGGLIILVAVAGWLTSRMIPVATASNPGLKIRYNVIPETWETIGHARKVRSVFLAILGISWFWFMGMAYLTQLPMFTREVLFASEGVLTLLLTMFSIGIGVGSLLCERLSGKKVELGLVPLGAVGLSVFGIDLFFACDFPDPGALVGISGFLHAPGGIRVLADLLLIGVFGGIYSVPLSAFVQTRTAPEIRARVIAANNIINSLLMVLATVGGSLLIGVIGFSIPQFFLGLAIVNILVAAYIYTVVPEFVLRFIFWILTHTMYRVRHFDLDRIPDDGPAVLVCNHVSYVDALIMAGACRRPIRFVMFEPIYRTPVLNYIFRKGKAIPITSKEADPETYHRAFEKISENLKAGELVCIFPEGRLTRDGQLGEFKNGIEKIVKRDPVPVIPMALNGLWGSFFSHKYGRALAGRPRRFWSKIQLLAGMPVKPENVTARDLRQRVCALCMGKPC